WNYIRGWLGEDWTYSLRTERNLKGSSFIAAAMCTGQALPLDMLMYYDARPCVMNGMFEAETFRPLKGYYPFAAFRDLRALGTWIPTESADPDVYTCAATDGESLAVMLTNYNDRDDAPAKEISLRIEGVEGPCAAEVYLLDAEHDLTLLNTQYFDADSFALRLDLGLYSTVLVKVGKG
ncbi:MAG: hypothetical protein IKZ41_04705, partial [Clostridia bacterium]|nr:hypothetical protein [Clostridia bacterium]